MATKKKRPKRKMTAQQKRKAMASAKRHGRSRPGLWENVNASNGKGPKSGRKKGPTRPGRRSKTKKTGAAKRRSRRRG